MPWRPVDVVAAILAIGLSSAVILILVVTGIQITQSSLPQVELSSNASQILTGAVGGLAGLLGGYLGNSLRHQEKGGDQDRKQP